MSPPEGTDNRSFDFQLHAAQSSGAPAPGLPDRIGKYRVLELLGEGGFGRVYRCHDGGIDRHVAIKVLRSDIFTAETREQFVAGFLHEARSAAKVLHDFVCPIYDVDEYGGLPFIVLPYCASGTLRDWARDNPLPPVPVALGLIRDVALGLHAAHLKGLIHRDVKPDNVLWDAERRRVLVTDFGLAKLSDTSMTVSRVKGTPRYMSPEQWQPVRGQRLTAASDVFGLGVMLFQMLTGQLPFDVPDGAAPWAYGMAVVMEPPRKPSDLLPYLDPALDAVCLKALAKAPADRYASAKEFADALEERRQALEEAERLVRAEEERVLKCHAEFRQGEMYFKGDGVPKDYAKARKCFEEAAVRGHDGAQYVLGKMYTDGLGVPKDYAKARDWFEKAAAQGNTSAQYALGRMYMDGSGVTQNYVKAREWFEKSQSNEAKLILGHIYNKGLLTGR